MIADSVRQSIEKHTAALWEENPFFLAARAGRLTAEQLRVYLNSLGFMFRQSLTHIRQAGRRATELGQSRISDFMKGKAGEEVGHDEWARADLRANNLGNALDDSFVTDAARALAARNTRIIEEDPRKFLAYMAFAEYFTVLVAPEFLASLETECGIPRSAMSAIANHGELDRDHVKGDLALVDEIAIAERWGARDSDAFLRSLDESADYIGRFLAACL